MASNIKGITIEIGGDTTELSKALTKVNGSSRSLQSELKQVDKLLKFDSGNVTLCAQKQDLLTEAVAATEEKLHILEDAEKQVQEQFARGEVSKEQYRALQREIEKTKNDLGKYETELEEAKKASTLYAQYIIDASLYIRVGGKEKPGFPYVYHNGKWRKGYAYARDKKGWQQGLSE